MEAAEIERYENEIDAFGLDTAWQRIIAGDDSYSTSLFDHAGEMYEYGLAYANKSAKKELGKYYTPQDVAHFMSERLIDRIEKSNIGCTEYHEPCVGVGDLLMELLSVMESHGMDVRDVIGNHLHISDIDGTALAIAAERVRRAYGVSPLIRWRAAERGRLFDASRAAVAESRNAQSGSAPWRKLPDSLVPLFDSLSSSATIGDIASPDGKFSLTVPASIRYYVTASFRNLSRSSKHVLHFDTEDAANAAYIALNSNLAYAFWRAYDGGITITSSLLSKIPVPVIDASGDFIDSEIGKRIGERAEEFRAMEDSCVSVKMNAGKPNENIKFGDEVLAENTKIILPNATDAELQAMCDYRSPSLSWLLDS